jgi:hypothetical protein
MVKIRYVSLSPPLFFFQPIPDHSPSNQGHFPALPNLSRDEGKKWIVNLMRDTRMGANAKIDLEKVTEIRVPLLSSFSIGCRTSPRSTDHLYMSTNP